MDRERGRLPAMQLFVEAQIEYDAAMIVYNAALQRRVQLKKERNRIQADFNDAETVEQLAARLRPILKERSELKAQMAAAEVKIRNAQLVLTGKQKETRQFIMKCPSDGCRGFLSSAWKCGTCQKFFCADCHGEKAGQKDEAHVCNADAKATASMIRQETRPCPKCGIRISKIDGCDQMWCIACQTTFSWNTGQVLLNTVVHNPHYYEYLRRANGGVVPREAGDVPCGGLPNAYTFTRLVMEMRRPTQEQKTKILDIVRCLSDIQYVRLPQFPLRQAANINQDADIRYLMKKISEEEWGTILERTETNGERKKEIGLILQTLLHVGSEKLTQVQNSPRGDARETLMLAAFEELQKVRDYTNKSLMEKGKQMGMVVPHITADWRWSWMKRAEMKKKDELIMPTTPATEELPHPVAQQEVAVAPPPQHYADVDEDEPQETVIVEIAGEMVEMTRQQMQQLLV